MLFEDDPTKLGHPLLVETSNKQGECMLIIRCHICRTLISYHNSSWTYEATHIRSHDITIAQNIAAADALASESKDNGEPFPIHKLPTPLAVKKEAAGSTALMRHTFAAPSYELDTQPYNRIERTIAKWTRADCFPNMTMETRAFRAMRRSWDPKCPHFRKKAITSQVGHCLEYCSVFLAFFTKFFSIIEVANTWKRKWNLWRAGIEKWTLFLFLLCLCMFPNMFMGSTSINKQMNAQQSGSCGVQGLKNNTIFIDAVFFMLPSIFIGSTSINKQMQAQ